MTEYSVSELKQLIEQARSNPRFRQYKDQLKSDKKVNPKKSFEKTYHNCREKLSRNPWDFGALNCLGIEAAKQGEYELAAYALTECFQKNPDQKTRRLLGVVHYNYGKQLEKAGNRITNLKERPLVYEQAISSLESAKRILKDYEFDPEKDPEVQKLLAGLEAEIRIIQSSPGMDFLTTEKETGLSAKLDKEDQGLEINVNGLEQRLNNSRLDNSKRLAAARKLSNHYESRGEYDTAINYLEQAQPLDSTSETKKSILNLKRKKLEKSGITNEGLIGLKKGYEQLIQEGREDKDIALSLGEINFSLKDWENCIRAVQKTPQTEASKKTLADILIGNSLLEMGNILAAELQFKEILQTIKKSNNQYLATLYGLGKAQQEQGKTDEAIRNFSEIIRINIDYKDALERISQM